MTFRYRNSSGAHTFDIDLGTSVVRLGSITSGFAGRAELGGPGTGGVELDDPGGTLDILPLQYFVVVESDCDPADDVVAIALINEERIVRGDASRASLRVGADRVWQLDLIDPNEFMGLRLAHSFSRPAETASARLTAMLALSNCPVHDLGYVVYPTHAMDKNDYTWQSFQSILADIAAQAGFNFFAYYDQSAGQFGLWFDDPDTSTAYSSTARISNYLSDLGAGVYAPLEGTTTLLRSPSRIASTAVVQYPGGYQTYYDSATADTYTAVDRVAPSSNIKSATAALAVATKYQKASDSPSDRVTTTIRVPRANVNDIREGHRMQARFSHLKTSLGDYSGYRWWRVAARTVLQPEETDQTYQMTLELVPAKSAPAAYYFFGDIHGGWPSSGSGGIQDFVLQWSDDNSTWTTALTSSAIAALCDIDQVVPLPGSPLLHRYWRVLDTINWDTVFMAPLDFQRCCLIGLNPSGPGYIDLLGNAIDPAWVPGDSMSLALTARSTQTFTADPGSPTDFSLDGYLATVLQPWSHTPITIDQTNNWHHNQTDIINNTPHTIHQTWTWDLGTS